MVLVTFTIVVLRYVFELGWVWMQECVLYMHAFVFLCGSGYALGRDVHVRVDILYRPLSERGKAAVNGVGSLALLIPFCLVIFHQAYPYVIDSWRVLEGSKDGGGLEAVFLLKTGILLFCVLLLLQALAILRRTVSTLRR
jgi:TRAP-type mannitol/chloroaromatic compound transport system permease small subunit